MIVVALGGNALLRRGEGQDPATQLRNIEVAAAAVAELAEHHRVVVTHGNGPQVGMLAAQAAAHPEAAHPLDVLGAETEGMIGYLIERALRSCLPNREIAALLTQVQVDAQDPALSRPAKPIGRVYDAREADRIRRAHGWTLCPEGGGFRRVVPSPEPRRILELEAIRILVEAGTVVICAGGGGVPVVVNDHGAWSGLEAVIDKDLAAALLARGLGADALLLLTDVEGIYEDWGTPDARLLRRASVDQLRKTAFASGSMAPKVIAACRFVAAGGRAGIGRLEDASAILDGRAGTLILADR